MWFLVRLPQSLLEYKSNDDRCSVARLDETFGKSDHNDHDVTVVNVISYRRLSKKSISLFSQKRFFLGNLLVVILTPP